MNDITKEIKSLRSIMPQAVITAQLDSEHIRYECDLRHEKVTPEYHEQLFNPIKSLFGDRLMERYSMNTSHFYLYVRYESNVAKK